MCGRRVAKSCFFFQDEWPQGGDKFSFFMMYLLTTEFGEALPEINEFIKDLNITLELEDMEKLRKIIIGSNKINEHFLKVRFVYALQ